MAAQMVLAQAVVEVVAKGVEKTQADAKKTADVITKKFADTTKQGFLSLGKAALATGALVAGFFAYFTRGAMAGTAEGERFGKAVELATRVVGDMFAPIVRLMTDLLIRFSKAILAIPASTRMLASGIVAAVAGIMALSGAVMLLTPLIGPLVAGMVALLNPFRYLLLAGAALVAPLRMVATGVVALGSTAMVAGRALMALVPALIATGQQVLSLASAIMVSVVASMRAMTVSILSALNPMNIIRVAMAAYTATVAASNTVTSMLSVRLLALGGARAVIMGLATALQTAATAVMTFGMSLGTTLVSATVKATAGLIGLLNPMNLVRAAMLGVQGVFASFTAIVSGAAAVFSGVFGLISALIGPILIGLVALEAKATGAFAPGITMTQRFIAVIHAMLNLWEGVKTMGMALYASLKPTIDWVIGAFKTGWNYILKLLGVDMGQAAADGSATMGQNFSSFAETIVGLFTKIREWWLKLTQFMSKTWATAIDGIAQGLAWIGEKVGVLPAGIQDVLKQDIEAQRKKDAAEQLKEMEVLQAANKKMMEDLRKQLEKNKQKAKEMAAPILEMLGLAGKAGGFHIKMDVGFETLQGTFERLQKSMMTGGATIEQAQLKALNGMREDIQKGNAELVVIKNKVGGAVE